MNGYVPPYRRQQNTNKNRRHKLKERMARLIDNSSLRNDEKAFLKPLLVSILREYAELYEYRNGEESFPS